MIVLETLYVIAATVLALIGVNALVLGVIYLLTRRTNPVRAVALPEEAYPSVVVQLPVYNEQHVVQRLVDAVSRLDYPRDRLHIQLLDDSSDETVAYAASAVEQAQARGVSIEHIRREARTDYKAGALAYGLQRTDAEFIAIFDADFAPRPDFLRQVIPYFLTDERIGLVQTRWSHLNTEFSWMTRAQALALDAHFIVEQTARHRGGLLINFAGTGGVWRRACITDSGGWHGDTLSEDIDLSYRAQLAGWRAVYVPDIDAPAEIPPLMMGFKRQQQRWATGTVQCFRKLAGQVLGSRLSLWQKLQAMIHLGGYFAHPLMILILLLVGPLMLSNQLGRLPLAGLGISMLGMPFQILLSQQRLYEDWSRRFALLPFLMVLGVGTSASNTVAVMRAFSRRKLAFERTPKFSAQGNQAGTGWGSSYMLPVDKVTWLEVALALYAACLVFISLEYAPALTPFMVLYAAGFGYVSATSLRQSLLNQQSRPKRQPGWGFSSNSGR